MDKNTPNCKKCTKCYYDEQWKEHICDKNRHAITGLNQYSTCKSYEEKIICREQKMLEN